MPVALLFDLDGTLITGGGAGGRAMVRAVQAWAGSSREVFRPDMAGRTDPDIFRDLLAQLGIEVAEPPEDLVALYVQHLRHEVGRTPGRLAPGVRELVSACAAVPEFRLALATGNIEPGARIKLEPHGLNPYFPVGGFGDDSRDRRELVATALRRVREREGGAPVPGIVIGDTPRDVHAAHANGLPCVAVATGPFDAASLAAAGADRVLPDLSDRDAFFEAVESLAKGGA